MQEPAPTATGPLDPALTPARARTGAVGPPGATATPDRSTVRGLPGRLRVDRTLVMGIVNVTPDSFSDGGQHAGTQAAVAHAQSLVARGADLVDVGGESTRPGAERVPEDVEQARVLPVVRELAAAGVLVSVDTMRASTAAASLEAGAVLVNDVSGGLADPRMCAVVADAGVPYVVMHWRGYSVDMASRARYDDVVAEVTGELGRRLEQVLASGVGIEQVVLDPGLGFAKAGTDDLVLLAHLDRLAALGRPLLVGASRKAFLGRLLADGDGVPRPSDLRDDATAAVTALAAAAGAWAVRVHDVGASADAVRVAAAVATHRSSASPAPRDVVGSASPAPRDVVGSAPAPRDVVGSALATRPAATRPAATRPAATRPAAGGPSW